MAQLRIAAQVRFQQINAAAMHGHRRGVRKSDATLGHQFEATMFPLGSTAISLKKQGDGGEAVALLVGKFCAQFEQQCEPIRLQRLTRPHHQSRDDARPHGVQVPCSFELALQTCTIKCVLQIFGTQVAQHGDDRILPDIGGVRHGWPPVAVGHAARAFMQQPRSPQHQLADGVDIASPDRIGHAAGVDQPRPAREAVAARQRGLNVGEFGGCGLDFPGMMLAQFCNRGRIALLYRAQQILGLMPELIEVGTNGKVTIDKFTSRLTGGAIRHGRTSFVVMPGVRCSGRKGGS